MGRVTTLHVKGSQFETYFSHKKVIQINSKDQYHLRVLTFAETSNIISL